MKVTGTGNPASLTLRLREREVAGLKEELGHQATVADDAATSPAGQITGSDSRPGPSDVLVAVTAMLDQLAATSANEQGRVVVSGPTWLLPLRSVARPLKPPSSSSRSCGGLRATARPRPRSCATRSPPRRLGARRSWAPSTSRTTGFRPDWTRAGTSRGRPAGRRAGCRLGPAARRDSSRLEPQRSSPTSSRPAGSRDGAAGGASRPSSATASRVHASRARKDAGRPPSSR
jgi:hypothetical protein